MTKKMFNRDAEYEHAHHKKCAEHAASKCRANRLRTRNDCYIGQSVEYENPITRSNQILGNPDIAFQQKTNNVRPSLRCRCELRDSELCQDDDLVEEACYEDQFSNCVNFQNIEKYVNL